MGIGLFWVPGACTGDPDRASVVVDGVPDPAGPGDLVLPLLQRCPTDLDGPELSLQRVLALVDVAGIAGQRDPRSIKIVGQGSQQSLPPLICLAIGGTHCPGHRSGKFGTAPSHAVSCPGRLIRGPSPSKGPCRPRANC